MPAPETGIARTLYNSAFRRNSVFVGIIFATAFTFEVGFDKVTDYIWDSRNKGKQWKDIKDNYQ
ncbi:cytochrome b-c1 complex subunit 9 [Catenaria anguillulae PL171]|uniref:Complex III subunit 9 n=1 Tax=Catenaria anguillulae PL171 TaxID=765915 RepID=A0A1Y2HQX3_9FUNG|nr:cytochrome b-c1 complex subunit 9 [Catenaria anguillulae PL171]